MKTSPARKLCRLGKLVRTYYTVTRVHRGRVRSGSFTTFPGALEALRGFNGWIFETRVFENGYSRAKVVIQ